MHMHMNSKCLTLLQSIIFDTHLFIIITAYICTSHKNRLPHVHRTGMMCSTRAMTVTHILHDLRGLHFRPRILRGHHRDHNLCGNYYLCVDHASQWLLNLTRQNPRIRRCRENHSIAATDLYQETKFRSFTGHICFIHKY